LVQHGAAANTWKLSALISEVNIVPHSTIEIQQLWSSCPTFCDPKKAFSKLRLRAWRKQSAAAIKVSEHVLTSSLPDDTSMPDALSAMQCLLEQAIASQNVPRPKKHCRKIFDLHQQLWAPIVSSPQDLEALIAIGEAASCCDTSFITLDACKEIVLAFWKPTD
jgi:hypothetical protein